MYIYLILKYEAYKIRVYPFFGTMETFLVQKLAFTKISLKEHFKLHMYLFVLPASTGPSVYPNSAFWATVLITN